jgi:hypothetical protein
MREIFKKIEQTVQKLLFNAVFFEKIKNFKDF